MQSHFYTRSAKCILAIIILSVRPSVCLSRPTTDSSPGELETPRFYIWQHRISCLLWPNFVLLGEEILNERGHQRWVHPYEIVVLPLSNRLVLEWLLIDIDLLFIITSTADKLSRRTDIDDLERSFLRLRFSGVFPLTLCAIQIYLLTYLNPQNRVFSEFFAILGYGTFQEWTAPKSLEIVVWVYTQTTCIWIFLALNGDFNGESFDPLCSRSSPYDGIKFGYPHQNVRFLLLLTNLTWVRLQIDTDLLLTALLTSLPGVPTTITLNDLEIEK